MALFPKRGADLETDCTCPDWSNPCKHIAAVYYLLAEEFDRDPFLLFRLRGMTRADLLHRVLGTPGKADDETELSEEAVAPDERFWQAGTLPDHLLGTVRTPPAPAALPKRLGKFPFWRAEEPLLDALEPVYRKAGRHGLEVVQGDA